MAIGDIQTDPTGAGDWFGQNAPPDYNANYWAPDRAQVLAANGIKDTSGKVWNGTTWVGGSSSGGAAKSIKDPNAFRDAWFASGLPKNVEGLKQFVAMHPEFDATITGSKGSKVLIGGQAFQAVRSAGINGGIDYAWDPLGPEGGSGESGVALGDFGSLAHGFEEKFKAPTIQEIRATPGYQFALTQGIDALDKRAAAQGTVLGGGEKKNVLEFATGLADQTAQQKYQNALGEYMNSYNIFRNNQNDVFNRYDTLSNRGTNAANAATS